MRNSYRKAKRAEKLEPYNHTWRGAYKSISDAAVFPDGVTVSYIDFDKLPCRGAGEHVRNLHGFDFGLGGVDHSAAVNCWLILPQALPDYEPESGQSPILYLQNAASAPKVPNHKLHDLADAVDPMGHGHFLCDHSPLMIEAMQASGISAAEAKKGPGSALVGFRKLASCQIVVSPACQEGTADEFTGLRYVTDKKTGAVKKPLKVDDHDAHIVAACRYAVSEIELSALQDGGVIRL